MASRSTVACVQCKRPCWPAGDGRCTTCRKRASHRQSAFCRLARDSTPVANDSAREERILRYTVRAALGLPLFQ